MANDLPAKELIETIRQQLTLNGTIGQSPIASFMRHALEIVSDQLYDKSTHFLLELLQNADDNTYECATPTLNFTYRPGSFRVDCNEVGFSEQNVKAICTIGESTKKGLNRSAGYIGEKGIGFKSVFKVADVVWISSRQFAFKFDRREELGMIAPHWEEFPKPVTPGYTSFYMKLAEGYDEEELRQDIVSFDPTLLLFLRRIRKVNLSVTKANGKIWSTTISRTDTVISGNTMVNLSNGDSLCQYAVMKYTVKHRIQEAKRPGCTESQLLLAFPIMSHTDDAINATQAVYAFLPIRDYGFKFLLQGDFLLTANREGIDTSSLWNDTIRGATASAFLHAINTFIAGPMKYQWLHFVPIQELSSFFILVQREILSSLAKKPVLSSWSSGMRIPSELVYVPKKFFDHTGVPFTLNPETGSRYLSPKYPDTSREVLARLGVKTLSDREFLEDLFSVVESTPEYFRSRSPAWHVQLSKAVLPLLADDDLHNLTSTMKLVPLRDGSWTAAADGPVFFSTKARGLHIPDGISIRLIDPAAEAAPDRRKLFQSLDARDCDSLEICKMIERLHSDKDFDPLRVPLEQLISHTRFLYRASWKSEGVNLWFGTKKGTRRHGAQIYIKQDCVKGSPLHQIYAKMELSFEYIHDNYLNIFPADKPAWISWLKRTFEISDIPRLVEANTSLPSPAFCTLFKRCCSKDLLWMFREHWRYYAQWLEVGNDDWQAKASEANAQKEEKKTLREILGSQYVQCRNGICQLSNAVLPAIDQHLDINPHLPMLELYDPLNPVWKILGCLGVVVDRSALYYIRCLESLLKANPDRDTLTYIYEQLRNYNAHESELIRTTFLNKRLIYGSLPSNGPKSYNWYTVSECIVKKIRPDFDYPTCTYFFRCIMMTDDGNLESLLAKLSYIDRSSTLSDISELFRNIGSTVNEASQSRLIRLRQNLQYRLIFPITRSGQQDTFDYLAPLGLDGTWFIADRDHLRTGFNGKLPLLAFNTEELEPMDDFLKLFGIEYRKLSQLVHVSSNPRGLVDIQGSYTNFLRKRAVFIQALIPKAPSSIIKQLENIEVNSAAEIVQTYSIQVSGTRIISSPESGEVALSCTDGILRLFMTEECLSTDHPSFELIDLFAKHCSITDSRSRLLLSVILTDGSLRRIQATFRKQGIHVDVTLPQDDSLRPEAQARYAGASGDIPTIPSPFNQRSSDDGLIRSNGFSGNDRSDGVYLVTTNSLLQNDKDSQYKNKKSQRSGTVLPFSTMTTMDAPLSQSMSLSWPTSNGMDVNTYYLGELMMSEFFRKHVGTMYNPNVHWTSALRTREGHEQFNGQNDHSSFTFADPATSSQITDILRKNGDQDATSGRLRNPVYHFEVAVIPREQNALFQLHIQKFDRMRQYHYGPDVPAPAHVLILAIIKNIYSDLEYEFHVNPWRLYTGNFMSLHHQYPIYISLNSHAVTSGPNLLQVKKPDYQNTGPLIVSHSMINADASSKKTSLCPADSHSSHGLQLGNTIIGMAEIGQFPRFSYAKLSPNNVRLLELLPGSNDEPLRGVVFHAPLEDMGYYRALSYSWGTTCHTERLWTPAGILSITPNLKMALHTIRQKQEPMILWVDRVCINQEDADEKATQIRLLPHIFQRATSVLAFAGDGPEIERAIETLMQIRAKGAVKTWPKGLPPVPPSWSTRTVPGREDPVWQDIQRFFTNPWFHRAWVVQEVVLAASVRIVCRKWVVDWNDLYSATQTIDREYRLLGGVSASDVCPWEFFLELAQHREWEARQTRWALINLLESFRYLGSTLTRDRFFALLGISSDGVDSGFQPDYTSPLEVVVKRYAAVFIKQGKVLQLLYRAGMGSQPSRFPSWIPDWTIMKPTSIYEASMRGNRHCASWIAEPQAEHDPQTDELIIRGYKISKVAQVSRASNTADQWYEYWTEIDAMMKSPKVVASWPPDVQMEMTWKVPIAGVLHPKTIADENVDLQASYNAFRRQLHDNRGHGSEAPSWGDGLNYTIALQENVYGWKFFTTHGGSVGIGPPSMAAGDTVYVFNGGGVPFVVRRSETRAYAFRLLGECYVHGLMNSKRRRMPSADEVSVRLH
ncbi:hypothetical protein IQ07DRAFT_680093 [Pyrenochaeta sp. DS3sAY3a]|nr:hypothetical protein IQ07DRAFT_680093 [Pyrenochaeta sp. DS3sAY3a]